jgi:hypothetical protein
VNTYSKCLFAAKQKACEIFRGSKFQQFVLRLKFDVDKESKIFSKEVYLSVALWDEMVVDCLGMQLAGHKCLSNCIRWNMEDFKGCFLTSNYDKVKLCFLFQILSVQPLKVLTQD